MKKLLLAIALMASTAAHADIKNECLALKSAYTHYLEIENVCGVKASQLDRIYTLEKERNCSDVLSWRESMLITMAQIEIDNKAKAKGEAAFCADK